MSRARSSTDDVPGPKADSMSPPALGPTAESGESTVSVLVLRGLIEAVEQAGVPRLEFLRRASFDPAILEGNESHVPRSRVFALCELAFDETGDEGFGLHWVERLSERMFAPVSHLIAHCSSLRQGLELLAQFFRLLSDTAPYRISEEGDHVTIRCTATDYPSSRAQRFESEMLMGGFWKLVRSFNADAHPEQVNFVYPAPAYHEEYTRLFDGVQRFDQAWTGLVFQRALLNARSPQHDDDVREALQELAERKLQRVTHSTPYSTRVRDFLVREGFPHRTDMQSAARALGISVRSLRRRLEEEGKAFNDVLQEAQALVAKHLLQDMRRTIQQVAFDMGFADPSTFHRAFKRWTGLTPSAYREQLFGP